MKRARLVRKGFPVVLFLLLMAPALAGGDAIVLKNGNRIEAQRVWEEDGDFKCDQYGGVVGFPKRDVLRVEMQQEEGPDGAQKPRLSTEKTKVNSEKAIRIEVRRLYVELMGFKDDSLFHKVGFAPENKYAAWFDHVTKLVEKSRAEGLQKKGIPVEDLLELGIEYQKSRGKETPFSRFANGEFRRAFDL